MKRHLMMCIKERDAHFIAKDFNNPPAPDAQLQSIGKLQLLFQKALETRETLMQTMLQSSIKYLQEVAKETSRCRENLSSILIKQSLQVGDSRAYQLALHGEIEKLNRSNEILAQKTKRFHTSYEDLEKSLQTLKNEVGSLDITLKKSKSTEQNLSRLVEEKETKISSMRNEIQTLKEKLDSIPKCTYNSPESRKNVVRVKKIRKIKLDTKTIPPTGAHKTSNLFGNTRAIKTKTNKQSIRVGGRKSERISKIEGVQKDLKKVSDQKIKFKIVPNSKRKNFSTNIIQCPFKNCERQFLKFNLKRHVREVHEKQRKNCKYCDKPYYPSNLSQHENRCSTKKN